ncbi:LysR family transcriptional regulator [Hyphomicrobium sp. xq]|uniref:LysR family transcriptional regulator n=1 Tax=Hyphomicrobium album TaxID=2665159 RepID=A0A6I3KHU7_9HYPH|nr:LysR family transcriptional regulator [Hyphomicrobium album]MTD94028.1 LysR family transcriptional regulator [Hyphomicrobium album]
MDVTAALRAFIRTIERGSITAAARDLGVSQPAVSKLIRNLEAHTGARLLERSSRAVKPTPIGLVLYEASGNSLATIDAALERVRSDMGEIKGTLRLHGPVCLGESHLQRIVMDFQRLHPGVAVELTLENRSVDLVHENIDLAVRIGRPTEQSYILRKIGLIRRILVAAPAYLSSRGALRNPRQLADHDVIVTDAVLSRQGMLALCKGGQQLAVPVSPILKTNNAQVLIAALIAGRGVGPVQLPLVTNELRTTQLVRALPQYEVRPSELYVVYPTSRFLRPAVRAFVDFAGPALKAIDGIT